MYLLPDSKGGGQGINLLITVLFQFVPVFFLMKFNLRTHLLKNFTVRISSNQNRSINVFKNINPFCSSKIHNRHKPAPFSTVCLLEGKTKQNKKQGSKNVSQEAREDFLEVTLEMAKGPGVVR